MKHKTGLDSGNNHMHSIYDLMVCTVISSLPSKAFIKQEMAIRSPRDDFHLPPQRFLQEHLSSLSRVVLIYKM